MSQKDIDRIKNLFLLLIAIVLVASFFFSQETVDSISDWFVRLVILPAVLSIAVGSMVEAFSGDALKRIAINIKVGRASFSVTAFFVAVVILKVVLF